MRTIKWGIMGAGGISTKFTTALNAMENTELVGIASRNLERAEKFAKENGIKRAYGSYEELVNNPDIDVVYIGTIHTEHKENAALAIRNGKSVLCEKPFTLNAKDTKELIELAKEHKVFLMEAMWTKFLPVNLKVKEWIAQGKIGNIKSMQINFGYQCDFDENNRAFNFKAGGGALLDVGIYPITYAINIMEELPSEIISTALFSKTKVDEQNSITFKFKNNVLAILSSAISANVGNDALIIGDKGRIYVTYFWEAKEATLYDREGEVIQVFHEDKRINGYEYEAYEVNQCLRDEKLESAVLPLKDTLDIMEIMDSIRESWSLKYDQEDEMK